MIPPLTNPKRVLACSDLHGFLPHFQRLLDQAQYDPAFDQLYILGDVLDRGPYPIGTLLFCEHLVTHYHATMLIGNHEMAFLDVIREHKRGHTLRDPGPAIERLDTMGAQRTYKEWTGLPEMVRDRLESFLRGLPMIVEEIIGKHRYVFVHGGLDQTESLQRQDADYVLWVREPWVLGPPYPGYVTVFGHTPTPDFKIWHGDGKIAIDTGAFLGERMAMVDLPSMQEYYVETCDTNHALKFTG